MPNDKPYIERRYVELEENVEMVSVRDEVVSWYANVDGPASTGERVKMSRWSKSAGEALLLLTEGLAEQGYVLR